jgi:DNA-binding NarL/FixJ family response regulator
MTSSTGSTSTSARARTASVATSTSTSHSTAMNSPIATLVAQGLVNKQVADRLHISEWTVCTHLRRIYSKLGVSTRSAMVFRCAAFVIDAAAQ